MTRRPLILITNDDGVLSPGLAAAAVAARPLGDLLIVAPRHQQTTMGRAFPRAEHIGVIEAIDLSVEGLCLPAHGVFGSPAQAVAHAVLELADRPPDLCIAGINMGENLGLSLTCSGTVGAAFEAHSHGIPAIAVSLEVPLHLQHDDGRPEFDWRTATAITRHFAERVLGEGLPARTCLLNINVPAGADRATEIRITRQSRFGSSVFVRPPPRRFDAPFRLESAHAPEVALAEADSDVRALCIDRVVSVTPITWDLSSGAIWDGLPAPIEKEE